MKAALLFSRCCLPNRKISIRAREVIFQRVLPTPRPTIGVSALRSYCSNRREFLPTTTISTKNDDTSLSSSSTGGNGGIFAAVDHSMAYKLAMEGRHGQQLALARLEGVGKDDPPFDPFLEEEEKLLLEQAGLSEESKDDLDDFVNDEDDYLGGDYDDDTEEEDSENNTIYNRDGTIRRKQSTLATLRAGYPAGGLFAVLEVTGSQHKVTTDDLLVVNRLKPVDHYRVGSVHTFNAENILLIGSTHFTLVGMPNVTGAEVDVMVEEITQDAKITIFKKRRRKHSQRKNGFRRDLTLLRVLDIRLPEEYTESNYIRRDAIDSLEKDEKEFNSPASSTTKKTKDPYTDDDEIKLKLANQ